MNQSYSKKERMYLNMVKELPCSVCGKSAPSAAHHIKQSNVYTVVALCTDCHQGSHNGWHGKRAIWNVMKMDEIDALAVTIKNIMESGH